MRSFLATAAIALLTASHPTNSKAQDFTALPYLSPPGSPPYGQAIGANQTGTIFVGTSVVGTNNQYEAVEWPTAASVIGLGQPSGPGLTSNFSVAQAVSSDGSVVAGYMGYYAFGNNDTDQAFIWTQPSGLVALGYLGGGGAVPDSTANAISADGTIVVGLSKDANNNFQAFRWTQATGMVGLGFLSNTVPNRSSEAYGITPDGSVIVGTSTDANNKSEAFRWTQATGMVGLGFLNPNDVTSTAFAVSANGQVVVGASYQSLLNGYQEEAYRWTQATGMVGLGYLIKGGFTNPFAVNGDGSVIVGQAGSSTGTQLDAFRWTAATGMQSIGAILAAGPDHLTGWQLTGAWTVSADGTTISGMGIDPSGDNQAFVAKIPVDAFAFLDLAGANGSLGSLLWGGIVTNSGPNAATLTVGSDGTNTTFIGSIEDGTSTTGLTKVGGGTLTLTGTNTYSGLTTIDSGVLQGGTVNAFSAASTTIVLSGAALDLGGFDQAIGALSGPGTVTNSGGNAATLTAGGNNASTEFSGIIADGGTNATALTKAGSGTLLLSGTSTYTGATAVNAGTLEINGSIAASNMTTVNSGALLTGTGVVGDLQVNGGGMFAPGATPGTSMAVQGNLAFQSGASYLVALNPSGSTMTNVSGTASLAGTVEAFFAPGNYMSRSYDILHAVDGLDGTTFASLTTVPPNFDASLGYSATDVFLNLAAQLGTGDNLNGNQQSVANVINNVFNGGGTLPPGFVNLFNLTGVSLGNALTALDGENGTGAEHAGFELINQFLGLMLDPYVDGRSGGGAGGPFAFAPNQEASFPPDIALAYASVFKAPPQQTFAQRWTAWASGFGGSARANGDPVIGSNTVTTSTFGYAAGLDYHYSPDTVLGFALAGGGTGWSLAQGLGTGRSNAFLAGLYGVTHRGPAYVGGALAFANNWFTTNRTALGDQLGANFQGQSYAARLEGGYRFAVPASHDAIGITPYAAIQAQNFHTPSYSETDLTAGGFGLSYAAMNGTDTRSELGARFDDLTALNAMPLILRARAAWAHDWVSNPALDAAFESLPGATFTVFGAPVPHDSALTSAGAQLFFTSNWSLLAKFDGEFAKGSQTYAGTGTLRYTW